MEILVLRQFLGSEATIGSLFINDQFFCYTLEDIVREIPGKPVSEWKVFGQTAIPRGRYEIILTHSPKFGYVTPYLLNVPGFSDIRIHKGNFAKNTEGCILVGMSKDEDHQDILESKIAFDALMPILKEASSKNEKLFISI